MAAAVREALDDLHPLRERAENPAERASNEEQRSSASVRHLRNEPAPCITTSPLRRKTAVAHDEIFTAGEKPDEEDSMGIIISVKSIGIVVPL
ncbi:MAG: hypothetical protein JSR31_01895 [Nitrospira sp.]|nr:hypothetical protein [Nitrospira sp.]